MIKFYLVVKQCSLHISLHFEGSKECCIEGMKNVGLHLVYAVISAAPDLISHH